ncbi:MAG: LamG-like jellyroll fold domain-containing protein [Acidobacteriota bacterium]
MKNTGKVGSLVGLPVALVFLLLGLSPTEKGVSANAGVLPLFHASYDKTVLADEAVGDEAPLANQNLKIVREGKRGGALYLDSGSLLTYDAARNLYAERGTLAFWWKLDEPLGPFPFSIVQVSKAQHSGRDCLFTDLLWTGETLELHVKDRNHDTHRLRANPSGPQLVAGRWFHLAFTWDELQGFGLYIDGNQVAHENGEFHLAGSLDQIGIHTRALAAYFHSGSERRVWIDDLRTFGTALPPSMIEPLAAGNVPEGSQGSEGETATLSQGHWQKRFGWEQPPAIVQLSSTAVIRKVALVEAQDRGRFEVKALDGKLDSVWPPDAEVTPPGEMVLEIKTADEPFNYVTLHGSFSGRVVGLDGKARGSLIEKSDSSTYAARKLLATPKKSSRLMVERDRGSVAELDCYLIRNQASLDQPPEALSYRLMPVTEAQELEGVSRNQIASLHNLKTRIEGRYLPDDRNAWVGVSHEVYKDSSSGSQPAGALGYQHIVIPPFLGHSALGAIELKLNPGGRKAESGPIVNIVFRDPVMPQRNLIHVDVRLPAEGVVKVLLDIRDQVVPAGAAMWLTLASNQPDFLEGFLRGAEVVLWPSETGESPGAQSSRREYLEDQHRWIKDGYQTVSQEPAWEDLDSSSARRLFRLVDALYRDIESVLRSDPKDQIALAYRGWLHPQDAPPDFKQPVNVAPDVPLWVFQQQWLLKELGNIAEWWITHRQRPDGTFGDGSDQDSGLVSNWVALELMDRSNPRLRRSVRQFVEASEQSGGRDGGWKKADQLYRERMRALTVLLPLDYGDPWAVERLMRAARECERLSGMNAAEHRHFRSSYSSPTEVAEERPYAYEEDSTRFLWHPALMLAWYNGNDRITALLKEAGNAMLSHWRRDRYPALTQSVRYSNDSVLQKGLPGPHLFDLMWGLFQLTQDERYLWLQDRVGRSPELGLVFGISGRWLEQVDPTSYGEGLLEELRKRPIWEHNLQKERSGVLARQWAYELTGDKQFLQDYQAALIKHLSQNRYLYTEAQMATGRLRLPLEALQRARLGGVAASPGFLFPSHAVSWEETGGNVAALVRKSTPGNLKVVVFNTSHNLQDVRMRVWQLENGDYEVTEGTDVLGADSIDVVTSTRRLPLKRGAIVPFMLRSRKTTVIEIRQVRKRAPLAESSDLAVGQEDLTYDPNSDSGQLVIHNLGNRGSAPFTVTLENERRIGVFKQELPGLEAPIDLMPRTRIIELKGLGGRQLKSLTIRVDPAGQNEEIFDENNVLTRTFHATR